MSKTITHEGKQYRQLPDGVAIWEGDLSTGMTGHIFQRVGWPRMEYAPHTTFGAYYYREVGLAGAVYSLKAELKESNESVVELYRLLKSTECGMLSMMSERNEARAMALRESDRTGRALAAKMIREDGE